MLSCPFFGLTYFIAIFYSNQYSTTDVSKALVYVILVWMTYLIACFYTNQYSTTGLTKAVVCVILVWLTYLVAFFLVQVVLHDWCNKCRGICYPACGMMHIKEPLLLIGKSSPGMATGFICCYLGGPLPCA